AVLFMEPNNFVHGGVRLNLAGREPQGCVQPNEVDAVLIRWRIAGVAKAVTWRMNVDRLTEAFALPLS
ncbi:MAG: hypothetical protein WB721_10255, partial [Pseudolabrys sp.]